MAMHIMFINTNIDRRLHGESKFVTMHCNTDNNYFQISTLPINKMTVFLTAFVAVN